MTDVVTVKEMMDDLSHYEPNDIVFIVGKDKCLEPIAGLYSFGCSQIPKNKCLALAGRSLIEDEKKEESIKFELGIDNFQLAHINGPTIEIPAKYVLFIMFNLSAYLTMQDTYLDDKELKSAVTKDMRDNVKLVISNFGKLLRSRGDCKEVIASDEKAILKCINNARSNPDFIKFLNETFGSFLNSSGSQS